MISPVLEIETLSRSKPTIEVDIPFFSGSVVSTSPNLRLVELSSLRELANKFKFTDGSSSISITLKSSLLVMDFSPKKVKTNRL